MPNDVGWHDGLRRLLRAHEGHLAASRALLTETEHLYGGLAAAGGVIDDAALEAAVQRQQAAFHAVQRAETLVQHIRGELSQMLRPANWTLSALEDAVQAQFGGESVQTASRLLQELHRTNTALLDVLQAIERLSKATEERLRRRLTQARVERDQLQSGRRAVKAYGNTSGEPVPRFIDKKK